MGYEVAQLREGNKELGAGTIAHADKTYVLDQIIGKTDGSKVYKAYQLPHPERSLALKLILWNAEASIDDLSTFASIEERVETYKQIHHPHVAEFVDFFFLRSGLMELPVIVRDYVEGESLLQKIQSKHLFTVDESGSIFEQLLSIAEYLETGTSREIVVRDIKPHNVILSPNNIAYLTDLELCTRGGTQTTAGRGTYAYMPPEQLVESTPTSSWDRYAIAKTMEHILNGKEPEHGKPVELHNGIHVPSSWKRLLAKMTAVDPAQRYGSATEINAEWQRMKSNGKEDSRMMLIMPAVSMRPKAALSPLPQELALIARNSKRVLIQGEELKERERLESFQEYASRVDPDSMEGIVASQVARGIRLNLEAQQGVTKQEEFMEVVNALTKATPYDVLERDNKRIVLVDTTGETNRVVHVYSPTKIYFDELRPEMKVDQFIEGFKYYSEGEDYGLKSSLDAKIHDLKNTVITGVMAWTATLGVPGSLMTGLVIDSLPAFICGMGITAGGMAAELYAFNRYKKNLIKKYEEENKKIPDPRISYSYHLPSTLIKAFLPEVK